MLICEECEENIEYGYFIEYKDIYFCSRDCLDNYIEQDKILGESLNLIKEMPALVIDKVITNSVDISEEDKFTYKEWKEDVTQ